MINLHGWSLLNIQINNKIVILNHVTNFTFHLGKIHTIIMCFQINEGVRA